MITVIRFVPLTIKALMGNGSTDVNDSSLGELSNGLFELFSFPRMEYLRNYLVNFIISTEGNNYSVFIF